MFGKKYNKLKGFWVMLFIWVIYIDFKWIFVFFFEMFVYFYLKYWVYEDVWEIIKKN